MKRLFAAVGALLALACLVAAALTTIWMWSVRQPVAERTAKAFEKADDALTLAENTVEGVRGNLMASRARMHSVRSAAPSNQDSSNFIQRSLERSLARGAVKKVTPDVNHVQHSLEKVTEASIVLNSILGSLRDVDGVDKFDNEQVRDLQSKLHGVTQASVDLSDLLDAPGQSSGVEAVQRSKRIAASLENVIELIDVFQKGVQSLRKKVHYYQDKAHMWIEEGPVFISIGLAWVMISQIVVLAVAVRTIRKPRPTAF